MPRQFDADNMQMHDLKHLLLPAMAWVPRVNTLTHAGIQSLFE